MSPKRRSVGAWTPDLFASAGIGLNRPASAPGAAREEMLDTGAPTLFDALALTPHRWTTHNEARYGIAICRDCTLDEYAAEGLTCHGSPRLACPTQHNSHYHGTCAEQFDSREAQQAHWFAAHLPDYKQAARDAITPPPPLPSFKAAMCPDCHHWRDEHREQAGDTSMCTACTRTYWGGMPKPGAPDSICRRAYPKDRPAEPGPCVGIGRPAGELVARGQPITCPECSAPVRAQLTAIGCVIPTH